MNNNFNSIEKELETYKSIVGALPQSMFLLDKNKFIIGIYNAAPETLAGYTVEDIVGNHVSVYANDPSSPFYQACSMLNSTFDTVFKTGNPLKFQYMILDTYLEALITKIPGDRILSQVRDISDIILNQQKIEKKKQNELYMALTAGGLSPWNYDVSKQEITFEYDKKSSKKSFSLSEVSKTILPEYKYKVLKMFLKIIEKKSTYEHIAVQMQTEGEDIRWMDIHAIPHEHLENGNVAIVIGSLKDITNDYENSIKLQELLKKNELTLSELEKAKEKAEESEKLKSTFLANMSHEIRTPLNSIVGFTQIISDTEDKEEKHTYTQIIKSNSELLLNLINDILDLSKIESGCFSCNNIIFNLAETVKSLFFTFRHKTKSGVELRKEIPSDTLLVNLDKLRITQVLTNFMTNAIKFTDKGSITIGFETLDNEVKLYVRDTGCGLSQSEKERVFDRFQKFNAFAQGTGLGTSIARAIVDVYNGKIGVESEPGQGSCFWASFPMDSSLKVLAANTEEELSISESLNVLERNYDKKGGDETLNILIAEDNDSNFILMKTILKEHSIFRVANGEEAVSMSKHQNFDLILMDIQMPILNGIEATKQIKIFNKNIPIVVITANAFEEDRKQSLEAGADAFLTKPINIQELLAIVEKFR